MLASPMSSVVQSNENIIKVFESIIRNAPIKSMRGKAIIKHIINQPPTLMAQHHNGAWTTYNLQCAQKVWESVRGICDIRPKHHIKMFSSKVNSSIRVCAHVGF